jgi:FAD:protein FMN transferase
MVSHLKPRPELRAVVPRLSLIYILMLGATPARADWIERSEHIMGTRITVELWHDENARGEAAIGAVMAEMHRIDAAMSHYKPDSEISRINAQAATEPVTVSPELFELLRTALRFSEMTAGAFDITYASVGYLYDYRRQLKPSEEQIRAALPGVSWRHLELNPEKRSVRFQRPGMRIDLGGIGKGYAVDRGIVLLQSLGVQHAVVTAGGDTRIIGDRLGKPWVVGIRHPDDKTKTVTRIPLVDVAMSTSGDYERYFDKGGVRFHHIINPRTGHSASLVRSATILGPTATETDGLSKTAFVLGAEKALEIINRLPQFDAVFVCNDGRVLYSKGLEPPTPH